MSRFLLLALACLTGQAAADLLLLDPSGKYLAPGQGEAAPGCLGASTAVLAGLQPSSAFSDDDMKQVGTIVRSSLWERPAAVLAVTLAGLTGHSTLDSIKQALGAQKHCHHAQGAADAASLARLAAATPEAQLQALDASGLQGCGAECMKQHIATTAQRLEAPFLLGHAAAHQMLGAELAGLLAAGKQAAQAAAAATTDTQLYHATLAGAQAVAEEFGEASDEAAQARAALVKALAALREELGADVVYQVHLVDAAPGAGAGVAGLEEWKSAMRRSLLSTGRELQQTSDGKAFTIRAMTFGAALILIWFTGAAIYVMCNMHFKADSLLYGRTKAD